MFHRVDFPGARVVISEGDDLSEGVQHKVYFIRPNGCGCIWIHETHYSLHELTSYDIYRINRMYKQLSTANESRTFCATRAITCYEVQPEV